eukprot:6189911-Pleurochrysis_carterae.AAC.3
MKRKLIIRACYTRTNVTLRRDGSHTAVLRIPVKRSSAPTCPDHQSPPASSQCSSTRMRARSLGRCEIRDTRGGRAATS